jgi:hypothetical protein
MPYCPHCGFQAQPQAVVCLRCGAAIRGQFSAPRDPAASPHDWLTTALLCFFLGVFEFTAFTLGTEQSEYFQLLTAGGCGVWWLFDMLMIILGNFRDSEGRVVTR